MVILGLISTISGLTFIAIPSLQRPAAARNPNDELTNQGNTRREWGIRPEGRRKRKSGRRLPALNDGRNPILCI
jgi:hypothetical protein